MEGSGGLSGRIALPTVSICMPAFNVGMVLQPALDSLMHQTYPWSELILVDDGSSDETSTVAQACLDDRIRYIRNATNLGGYQTMNKAVSLATGDLVAIYHADDIYEPTIVEKEVAYLQSHPALGAVFSMDHYIDDQGRIFGGTSLPPEFRGRDSLSYDEVFPYLLRHKNVLFRCPTFMARRTVLDAVGPFDAERYDIAADIDMWIRILRQYPVGILEERLVRYRAGKSQWSTRYNYLRTTPELCFLIMDRYLMEDNWSMRLSRSDLSEYAFHRCEDETFRALNWLLKGEPSRAAELLRHGYPWAALLLRPSLQKARLLAFRALLGLGVRLFPAQWVQQLLYRQVYRRRFVPNQPETSPARSL